MLCSPQYSLLLSPQLGMVAQPTAPCQAPCSCRVFPPLAPTGPLETCHRAPTGPLETNSHCRNRHWPLLSTLWFPVMNDTSLSKEEDIFAIKCMIRNT